MKWMAQSLYLHKALLEDENFKTCFNHHHHMMIAARIWKDGYIRQTAGYRTGEDDTRLTYMFHGLSARYSWRKTTNRSTEEENLTRARMSMCRVCAHHPGQGEASKAQPLVGYLPACPGSVFLFQVYVIAGDGFIQPHSRGSRITVTKSVPVRVQHLISCS